eukprot:TRINITY_DN14564_c0_g1_i3.p1 TRINITY_DN14564_c0_g1~~TRINITY_DN14564_c0_g1_i3.p1  ORF type:complete len:154 (+),score=53.67 TRINITY_DN14564_c0_g1_i3:71-532(+)
MGADGSKCCSGQEVSNGDEIVGAKAQKMDAPGAAQLPMAAAQPAMPPPAAASPAAATPAPKAEAEGMVFDIILDKSSGTRLGIDVDHQDGATLLIEQISSGLVEEWNKEHPEKQVMVGDRIFEVNGVKDEVLQLVDECKLQKVLKMKLRRASA